MRSWARFSIFAVFGVAVFAGTDLEYLVQDFGQRFENTVVSSRILSWVMVGLAIFEFYNGPQKLIVPGPRPVDQWLASFQAKKTIIQMPLSSALSGQQMYYSMFHNQRVASAYGTYFPILFEEWYPELNDFPSDQSIELLSNWGQSVSPESVGIDYVLIDEADVPLDDPLWEEVREQRRLIYVTKQGNVWVYRIQ
jgi:hypothetical protein